MRWVSTFCHCRRVLDVLNTHSKEPKWETTLSNPKVVSPWQNRSHPYEGKGHQEGGKGKSKGGKGVLPKFLLGRDNTNMDMHGRRLCFNYQINKCSEAADGAECSKGWHLCCRKGCFAPMLRKTATKRSDARAASAHWLVLLGISQIA